MNKKAVFAIFIIFIAGVFGFCVCPASAADASIEASAVEGDVGAEQASGENFDFSRIEAVNAPNQTRTLGSVYPDTGYKFEIEINSKGAGIVRATLSEFDDGHYKDPQPLNILLPVEASSGTTIYSLGNLSFELTEQKQRFPLGKLHWRSGDVVTGRQAESQSVSFETILTDAAGKESVKLTKIYRVMKDSYHLECDITIENLSNVLLKPGFDLQGPIGLGREGIRADMRSIVAAFETSDGKIESVKRDNNKLRKAKRSYIKNDRSIRAAGENQAMEKAKAAKAKAKSTMQIEHKDASTHFIWAAATNKYFTAILRPIPQEGDSWPKYARLGLAQHYDPGFEIDPDKKPDGDENVSFMLKTLATELAAAGEQGSSKTFRFQLYLGPKDKDLFAKNDLYKKLGYFHTIRFLGCLCPQSIINPLAFTILATMKMIYKFIPNYGVVIMILVFLVRILLHPITKKSQISMMNMQKLGPKIEEIKKKYATNKAELNKQVMGLYRQEGVSPVMSFLPMLLQMPILIALYSAIYVNIDLRGAAFLPFWITDLSAPDALVRFTPITLPIIGELDSFNLLPILLAMAMFFQQKLMSRQTVSTNSQAAQQQKMMMIMMPIMMLFIFYKVASGLNLYFMASTFAGVIEQIVIRKHIREKDAAEATGLVSVTSKTGGKAKKKKPKPFFRDH